MGYIRHNSMKKCHSGVVAEYVPSMLVRETLQLSPRFGRLGQNPFDLAKKEMKEEIIVLGN